MQKLVLRQVVLRQVVLRQVVLRQEVSWNCHFVHCYQSTDYARVTDKDFQPRHSKPTQYGAIEAKT